MFGVVTTDLDWNVTFANEQFSSQLSRVGPIRAGMRLLDVIGADRFAQLAPSGKSADSSSPSTPVDIKLVVPDGDTRKSMLRLRSWPMINDGIQVGHLLITIDISDRYEDVRRYQVADDLIEAFMGVVRDAVVVADANGIIRSVSNSVEEMFGWRREDLVGASVELLMTGGDAAGHAGWMEQYRTTDGLGLMGKRRTVKARRRSGEIFPIEVRVVENVVGDPPGFVAFIRDLGEIEDLNRRIEEAHQTDELTGLLTQHSFTDALRRSTADAEVPLSLVKVDIARFHHVNSAYGYETGDALLKSVAREIRAVVGELPAGRLGGDEFAFVVPTKDVARVVPALSSRVEGRGRSRGIGHPIRLSVGVAHQTSGSVEDLLKAAYSALRVAQSGTPTGYVEHSDVIAEAAAREVSLLADIHAAVRSRQLVTYFQPEIDLRTGLTIGHEALVRWNHPERGLIPPDQFLFLAKAENLMPALGVQVLAASLDFIRKSADLGHVARVWVNLSSEQLLDDSVVEYARAAIGGGLDPNSLGFEVTEHDAFVVESDASNHLQSLRDLGLAIAIDDFGTGYSSLTQLRNVPAEVVKLDRSFLMSIHTDEMQKKFVGSCIDLAHTLDRTVVAEGIESEADGDLVARLGCDMAQGYWYGRPVPAAEALSRINADK